MIGTIISGDFSEVYVRQKTGGDIEIGDLFVSGNKEEYIILEAFDLLYGSQIGQQHRELMAGMQLEGYEAEIYDAEITNYLIAKLKPVLFVSRGKACIPKKLPSFFSSIRRITADDFGFLGKPADAVMIGSIRSGSKALNVEVSLPGRSTMSHHILVSGTTGRGKSKLIMQMAWSLMDDDYSSMLILDPHDEYYGRNSDGLKDKGRKVSYYSLNPPPGTRHLIFNVKRIVPGHFDGIMTFSDAQREAMFAFYNAFQERWIEELVLKGENMAEELKVKRDTISVLQRKFNTMLSIRNMEGEIQAGGVFDTGSAGMTTANDICSELESGNTVIIDTSLVSGDMEILIGSMLAREIFSRYKRYKLSGEIRNKPIISIVLEEAPRVLNNDAVKNGNIFSSIAREGRKFSIGLVAITQLPSLIPKEILANMNTKIILGTELASERNALIESASQDLSKHDRNIASLGVGEAIISSTFTKFAMPVKIGLIDISAGAKRNRDYSGILS